MTFPNHKQAAPSDINRQSEAQIGAVALALAIRKRKSGLRVMDRPGWKKTPHNYAKMIHQGKWTEYPYLRLIGNKIAKAVREGGGRIIVEMPPRHGKSEFISHATPLWFLDRDNYPEKRIILATYAAQFAELWGGKVRETAKANNYVKVSMNPSSQSKKEWQTMQGGGMVAAGVNGPITGRGFDLGIIDDPIKNWEQAKSLLEREKAVEWFNSTFYTRQEPGATIILLMTRWHQADLAGYLQEVHEDDWDVVRFPAMAECVEGDPGITEEEIEEVKITKNGKERPTGRTIKTGVLVDILGRKAGDALCPERYDVPQLLKLQRGVGPQVWAGLYQQRPAPLEGGLVPRDSWSYWDFLPHQFDTMFQSWDLSFKGSATSSFVCGLVFGKKGANLYVLDYVRRRLDFVETQAQIRAFHDRWPDAFTKYIEDKANGPAIISSLGNEVPGLTGTNPQKLGGDKEARAASASPIIRAGNVYLPNPSIRPWGKHIVEEHAVFPNGLHNDIVDTMSQAILMSYGSMADRLRKLNQM